MDLRRWRGVRFVSRAPTESGDFVDIRVTRMSLPHVLWWHSHVQPLIDQDPERADRDWNWLLYVPFSTLAGGVLARQPAGLHHRHSGRGKRSPDPLRADSIVGSLSGPQCAARQERLCLVSLHGSRGGSAHCRGSSARRRPLAKTTRIDHPRCRGDPLSQQAPLGPDRPLRGHGWRRLAAGVVRASRNVRLACRSEATPQSPTPDQAERRSLLLLHL